MPTEIQAMLVLLLEQTRLPVFTAALSHENASASPICLTIDTVKLLACKSSYKRLQPLLSKYVELAASNVRKVQEPFCGWGDVVQQDLTQVSESLDLVEECLQKVCVLLKNALRRPKGLLEIMSDITILAESILEQIDSFRLYITEKRARSLYLRRLRGEIEKKLADLLEKLSEFQRILPGES